ncbi:CoA-transferase family III domain-containing protein [Corynascus novoguineensis]|uniref:CoA-transferase family III domain-containing protein n=1 Tax=Corynascus novoguineensis TaxID=1126955 RepID=A0AAN7CZC3_9PEZI|nr:CoA-transferase family III domain-containing protein [Corynascus novoguineensis]
MPGEPPLKGIKVLEFAGLAPGPFAGLMLADAGASVLRIDRPSSPTAPPASDLLTRHKASLAVDLKNPRGAALVRALAARADVLIDPYRPGVLEALSLGPAELHALNPRLVYARLTGFRRDGRFATMAGHDINYLAVSGSLALLGRAGAPPTPPANLLGDFAGGGAMLVQGVVMALLARERTGRGQVVEANMVDGASYLASFARLARRTPTWDRPRGENLLDSGCPFYDCYETADDGRWVAVGALEERFFFELVKRVEGLQGQGWEKGRRHDRAEWPELRRQMAAAFRAKTRAEWERVFEGTDACCTPVYDYGELEQDRARKEGDQRPAVTLRETPWLAVRKDAKNISHGQGPGVEGEGYIGRRLQPGSGGEETLKEWFGWSRGDQFEVEAGGGLVLKDKAKL